MVLFEANFLFGNHCKTTIWEASTANGRTVLALVASGELAHPMGSQCGSRQVVGLLQPADGYLQAKLLYPRFHPDQPAHVRISLHFHIFGKTTKTSSPSN